MAKKNVHLTHTEILCLAIRQLEHDAEDIHQKLVGISWCEDVMRGEIQEKRKKIDILKEMYRLETGTDY